ncbi:hypothetical protein KY317_02790 [Candidatus Woesearchaeota archaeon]|nr:hypothetical protein [Candidatus Woesearchaeota archaeon]
MRILKHDGLNMIVLGIFAILVWALLSILWVIGIILILAGLIWWLIGKKK